MVHAKEQTYALLIITWYGRSCTKLVLKLLADENSLFISVLCIAPFLQIKPFQFTWWLPSILVDFSVYLHISATIFDNWNEKRYSKSNILTMGHKLVFGNSTSATVYSLPNTIIYLKAIKYLNIRLRQIRVWKIEDRMLYYGCKNLGLFCWKLKTQW